MEQQFKRNQEYGNQIRRFKNAGKKNEQLVMANC